MLLSVTLLAAPLFAAPVAVIEGAAECPSPEAVGRELARIVSAPQGHQPTDRAVVTTGAGEVLVVLSSGDGRVLGERRLLSDGTCDELARSVAVVLAAWITDVHPEYLSLLPAEESSAAFPETPAPSPEIPAPEPAAPRVEPPPTVPPRATAPRAPSVSTRFRFSTALGIGPVVSTAGGAPAGEVSVCFVPDAQGFGASAFAIVTSPAEQPLGAGRVRWTRWPLGAGALVRTALGAVVLDVEGGAMLGWLRLEGRGFARDGETSDITGGAFVGARVAAKGGLLRPFVGSRLLAWVSRATAAASLPDAEIGLPLGEGVVLAGVGWAP